MKKPRLLQRQILVRGGQYTYGLAFGFFAMALSTGMVLATYLAFFSSTPDSGLPPGTTFWPILLMSIPATLVSFIMGIVLSHRTFGPLVRISAFVEELKQGNYAARLKLRDKDHLTELVPILNDLAECLEQRHPGTTKQPE